MKAASATVSTAGPFCLHDATLLHDRCFIGGAGVDAGAHKVFDVCNPADGALVGVVPDLGREGSKYGIDDYVKIKYICMNGRPA